MRNLDKTRLARLAIAGAIAGLIVFLIFNPSIVRDEQENLNFSLDPGAVEQLMERLREQAEHATVHMLIFGATFGALTGGMLALADEIGSPLRRAAGKIAVAVFTGAGVGGVASVVAQLLFSALLPSNLLSPAGVLSLIFARVVGWAVMGVGAGAGIGIALGSARRAMACVIGGLVGGFVGGVLFDMVGGVAGSGTASRFIGFTAMGAAVGAAVAWVEDIYKQNWVTVLSGPKEGRSFILSKPVTTIGRDELADIPLFGDPSIAKQHACLQMAGSMVTLQGAAGQQVLVNGTPVQDSQLRDSDLFQIGRYALRFHQKASQHAYTPQVRPGLPPTPCNPQPSPDLGQPQAAAATGRIVLTAVAGPHSGQVFQFGPGVVKIGREADCQVLLAQDTMISRSHAEIGYDGVSWHIRDSGSTNGLWLNGARITRQILNYGDQVGVGQTVLRVDGV